MKSCIGFSWGDWAKVRRKSGSSWQTGAEFVQAVEKTVTRKLSGVTFPFISWQGNVQCNSQCCAFSPNDQVS